MSTYTAQDIDVLEGLEGVRKRPSIYVGDINKHALFQIIKEAIDNAVDEALSGANDCVFVELDKANMSILVADQGRGIPVETHTKTKISTLTTILTYIHAGGKFSGKEITVGTHGVGISAANALSSKFEVWTYRAKNLKEDQSKSKTWYYQCFEKGIPISKIQENVKPSLDWKCGTIVRFIPDSSIFIKNYKLPFKRVEEWLYSLQYLCPGLEFILSIKGFKDPQYKIFKSKNGISQWVDELVSNKQLNNVGSKFEYSNAELQTALQWTNADESSLLTYVNCCPTMGNGSHFEGFRKALNDSLSSFTEEKYSREDLRIGLVGILHFKMNEPTYDTQTKERLSSDYAENKVKELLTPVLIEFFSRNKSLADTILTKAVKLKQARDRFKKDRATIKNLTLVSRTSKHVLPAVLLGAPHCRPENRELFICEGKSASGTLKNARDPKYQEVLPLKGKFTNAAKFAPSKVLQNKDIQNIFTAIGSNQNTKDMFHCDPKKARVGKILWLPDEDDDGKHIRCLGLTLMMSYMKELISAGMVYIVNAPLYITSYKDKKYYGKTLENIRKQLPKNAKIHITRMKGWGECVCFQTLIPTSKGFRFAGELDKVSCKIASPFGSEKFSHFIETEPRDIRKIQTKEGYSLQGTEDQEVLTISSQTGYLEWKTLRRLDENDFVALDRNVNLWSTEIPIFSKYKTYNCNFKFPKQMTKELARILGYFIGDGFNHKKDSGVFFGDKEAKDDFIECVKVCFPSNYVIVGDQGLSKKGKRKFIATIGGNRKAIKAFLNYLGIKYEYSSYIKEIPWCILQAPKEYVIEFLKALFECGGTADSIITEYYTASFQLYEQLKVILLNLNIITRGYPIKSRYNSFTDTFDSNIYKCKLTITGKNIDIFYNTIGFISKWKNDKYVVRTRNTNIDIIPYIKAILNIYISKYRVKDNIKEQMSRLRIARHTGATNFTYSYLEKHSYLIEDIKKIDLKLADTLKFCLIHKPFWSRVSKNDLVSGRKRTFDITMPETQCFVGNGIICHNCDAPDMKVIACNPQTRSLFKVELTDRCIEVVEELMGSDSLARKKLLGI